MKQDNWRSLGTGRGNWSGYYGDNGSYHGGGYGYLRTEDGENGNKYTASGRGDSLTCDREYARGFVTDGYGRSYQDGDGLGSGEGYGYSYCHGSGYGNGSSNDYDEYGCYGCVNRDDGEECEDGHGNGGMYDFEDIFVDIYCYHTHRDFAAYGEGD
jgi:hypothetical protein